MKLLGYILDEEDFEVVPTINRTFVTMELEEEVLKNDIIFTPTVHASTATFSFIFKPNSTPVFSFTSQYDMTFTQLIGIENITRIIIKINNIGVFDGTVLTTPITISQNDVVEVRVTKPIALLGEFLLIGNTI
jgi:hypothetical protein